MMFEQVASSSGGPPVMGLIIKEVRANPSELSPAWACVRLRAGLAKDIALQAGSPYRSSVPYGKYLVHK